MHGQLYLFQSALVFDTKIFGSRSKVIISHDAVSLTSEQFVIPHGRINQIAQIEEKKKNKLLVRFEAKATYILEIDTKSPEDTFSALKNTWNTNKNSSIETNEQIIGMETNDPTSMSAAGKSIASVEFHTH